MAKSTLMLLSLIASSAIPALADRLYTIVNKCPMDINLIVNGESQGNLAAKGGLVIRTYPENWSGIIYTDTNGGNPETGEYTTRAGFNGETDNYYVVAFTSHPNVGVSIAPQAPINNGFCNPVTIDSRFFSKAYPQPGPTTFPPPSSVPPEPPLYACPGTNIGYQVTFCPGGSLPWQRGPAKLHPNGNIDKCLDVRGGVFANGTPVQIYDCNDTPAQGWRLNSEGTSIVLWGTDFCLDAGSNPGNGVGMKIWTCYGDLPAQSWYWSDDNRITLQGKGLCLDLPNGSTQNGNQVQTWQCSNGNTNQIWGV
ncbi:ricin B lectin domain-containing protein [Collybia nuda]|uniref:Ricin B lectin domain-containing protein n=1 Tax=Collybia nuda TaxID=64659 RepID=A0A9P5YDK1_9AGAR|nr:ricin B lectin domain-containing protein [Collybia nuda]